VQINHKKSETKKYPPTFLKKAIKNSRIYECADVLRSLPLKGQRSKFPPTA